MIYKFKNRMGNILILWCEKTKNHNIWYTSKKPKKSFKNLKKTVDKGGFEWYHMQALQRGEHGSKVMNLTDASRRGMQKVFKKNLKKCLTARLDCDTIIKHSEKCREGSGAEELRKNLEKN